MNVMLHLLKNHLFQKLKKISVYF